MLVIKEVQEEEHETTRGNNRRDKDIDMEGNTKFSSAKESKESKKARVAVPGEEYKSKKSGGDVWRKGKLEPHAYIPLDAKMLAGRNAREAMEKLGGVMDANAKSKRARMAAAVANAKSHVVVGNRKQREARNKNKRKK